MSAEAVMAQLEAAAAAGGRWRAAVVKKHLGERVSGMPWTRQREAANERTNNNILIEFQTIFLLA